MLRLDPYRGWHRYFWEAMTFKSVDGLRPAGRLSRNPRNLDLFGHGKRDTYAVDAGTRRQPPSEKLEQGLTVRGRQLKHS